MAKKDGRNRSASAQAAIREQVVGFLKKETGTQRQATEIFGLSLGGVEKIWRQYKQGGKRAIAEKKRGVREGKKITGEQAAEIRKLVKDKLPAKYVVELRSARRVIERVFVKSGAIRA